MNFIQQLYLDALERDLEREEILLNIAQAELDGLITHEQADEAREAAQKAETK